MKLTLAQYLPLLAIAAISVPFDAAHGSPARPVIEVMEQLSKASGRVPAKGAAEALQAALAREGAAALDAARRGGLGLPEAAARHGDDVFRYAVRVPEAAPILAARADELLPLARVYGDDFLRLEAHVPGLGDDAARLFPRGDSLARLASLPADQAREIVSYAHHATDARAPTLLLRAVERGGSEVLQKLDPKMILALGLSSAMVITASGGAVAAGTAPDELFGTISTLGLPISGSIALIVLAGGSVLVVALALRLGLRARKRPNQPSPPTSH